REDGTVILAEPRKETPRMWRYLRLAVIALAVVALAALAAGCGSKKNNAAAPSTTITTPSGNTLTPNVSYDNGSKAKGGVYRVGYEQAFGFTDNFDPTGEYLGSAWGLYSNLLIRSLIGYKHVPGAAGNDLIGDLATSVPTPTDGGLTYTYKI